MPGIMVLVAYPHTPTRSFARSCNSCSTCWGPGKEISWNGARRWRSSGATTSNSTSTLARSKGLLVLTCTHVRLARLCYADYCNELRKQIRRDGVERASVFLIHHSRPPPRVGCSATTLPRSAISCRPKGLFQAESARKYKKKKTTRERPQSRAHRDARTAQNEPPSDRWTQERHRPFASAKFKE